MYTSFRLEWHPGDESTRTPQVSVWSCKVASVTFGRFNRLAAAHARAKTTEHLAGFFLLAQTGLHSLVRPQPGGVEEKGTRYDFGLGGSSRTIRATGRIVKSGAHRKSGGMTIPSGGETFVPSYLMSGVGGSLGEKDTWDMNCIKHKMGCYE